MCGVFGFVAKGQEPVNLKLLRRVARTTQRRGPHAWGMAWIDGAGRLKMFKQTGRVTDALALLAMASDARLLIGHCRYATQGNPENNLNNHPHPADGGWIVHNGVIRTYRRLIDKHDLHPATECVSEVLGLLTEHLPGDIFGRAMRAAMMASDSPLVMLGLWKPGRLVAVRNGNPLCVGETGRGYYLGSLSDDLPGTVSELPNGQALEFGDEVTA